jgi:hypothetical protein
LPEAPLGRGLPGDIADVGLQDTVLRGDVAPANDAFAPEQRECVVTANALVRRGIGLEPVGPLPEKLKAPTIPPKGALGQRRVPNFRETQAREYNNCLFRQRVPWASWRAVANGVGWAPLKGCS